MNLMVTKFGGTSLGNAKRIKNAAQSVIREYMKGTKIVVVVSAINKTTDDLMDIIEETMPDSVTDRQLAEILCMGEMTSSRILSSVIESMGVKSEYIDPYHELWPIITDDHLLSANIDFESTEQHSKNLFKLLDQGIIPVICGFVAKDKNNIITTLGRGGSDITAFLLSHCLSADEVVIVTDVDGVMSTDPNKLQTAKILEKISVEEMRDLTTHGAQVLHSNALRYKDPNINAKIMGFNHGDLTANGTTIFGPMSNNLIKTTTVTQEPISILSIVGEEILNTSGIFLKIVKALAEKNINIYGISTGQNSITLFVDKKNAEISHKLLHELVVKDDNLSSISLGCEIAMITINSPDFIDTPGIISDITLPLRENNINIVEITSSQTSVILFVEWSDGKRAYNYIKGVLE